MPYQIIIRARPGKEVVLYTTQLLVPRKAPGDSKETFLHCTTDTTRIHGTETPTKRATLRTPAAAVRVR